ncbi:MAG: DNA mismatch repair protein MutS [Acidimicrobiia bacterium]
MTHTPGTHPIATLYTAHHAERAAAAARADRRHAHLGWLRILVTIATLLAAWFGGLSSWPWLATGAAAFLVLAVMHGRVTEDRGRAQRAVEFYRRGLVRIHGEWVGTGDAGARFQTVADADATAPHPYARDLDLFGRGSAFELLGTCRTEAGQGTLARWLLTLPGVNETQRRQEAVQELAPLIDLRERLSVEGDTIATRVHPDMLKRWATAPAELPRGLWLPVALALLSVSVVGAAIWRLTGGGPAGLFELCLFVQIVVALALRGRVVAVIGRVDGPARDLDLLVHAAQLIERAPLQAPLLRDIQNRLRGDGPRVAASDAIRAISRLDALLASRRNVMFAPMAAFVLWGTQLALRVESWRDGHGRHIPDWLDAIGDFEAIAALAGFAAEHPSYVYPTVEDARSPRLAAEQLAHPLLPAGAIANTIRIGAPDARLWLVSGSNMSGKSTWLRTIGLTVVLARTGAPVRALRCALTPLEISASIRVGDSLQDGQSRFFAEVLRLRQVVDRARDTSGQMLFLLDEMLSGTNSHDRRQGAEGILRGLISLGAIGLATTHDLALGAIAQGLGESARQVHFSDRLDAGTLEFDYVLRDGPVQNSNALALMRSVGLDVDAR